ncbi:unnamed protein product, partial [Vitis vinifera]
MLSLKKILGAKHNLILCLVLKIFARLCKKSWSIFQLYIQSHELPAQGLTLTLTLTPFCCFLHTLSMSGQQQRTKNVGVWVEESDFLEINITAIGKDILLKIDEATELTIKCKKGLQIMIPDPNKTQANPTKTQAAKVCTS